MLPAWAAIALSLGIVLALWTIAAYGDRDPDWLGGATARRFIYALAIVAFGGGWSFYNAVGSASDRGIEFLPIYCGPILLFAVFYRFVARIVRLTKSQNITSISDFVSIRYGKATSVGVIVALIVTIGTIPQLGLQLRTIAQSLSIFIDGALPIPEGAGPSPWLTAAAASVFALLVTVIGTRRLAGNEHQNGLMLTLAVTSLVKVFAFVAIGMFVCWGMFKGLGDLTGHVANDPRIAAIIDRTPQVSHWIAMTLLSFLAALVMPRSFYVTAVENRKTRDIRTAAWLTPMIVFAMSIFVLPLAAAGLATFPQGDFDRAFTILALPIAAQNAAATALALIGALSSCAALILLTTVALVFVVANDLMMPAYLRMSGSAPHRGAADARSRILWFRRGAVVAILLCAWLCAVGTTSKTLSSLSLTFVVLAIQIAPAAIGGVLWTRGTTPGAIGGCVAGVAVWAYTLLLPLLSPSTSALLTDGPLGFGAFRPTDLFDLHMVPFDQGLLWSFVLNVIVYATLSLSRPANANERVQANLYARGKPMALAPSVPLGAFGVTAGDLFATTVFYVGKTTAEPSFHGFHAERDITYDASQPVDAQLVGFSENLIASTVGAASSRTIISQLLARHQKSHQTARRIFDDVSFEVQNSRDVLQHAIDMARDGMAVFDRDLRLVAWNRAYRDMFELPPDLMRVGVPLDVLVRSNADRGVYGVGDIDELVASRLETLTRPTDSLRFRSHVFGRVLEMHSVRLYNGGLFFTYVDATDQARSEADLEAENVTLEHRVRERTEELQTLNFELARAKAEADDANFSKTRFLAAASHDLLQPLNAARLYTTSLRERLRNGSPNEEAGGLATHIDESLEAVEDILGALLEISHLDAGATKSEITSFSVENVIRQLQIEFAPAAAERGLRLRFVRSSAWIMSDRRLLSRLLQNLISNAIKYTNEGGVLVGVRNRGREIRIDVVDTGLGIPDSKQTLIFREFERLPSAAKIATGAGLGLSIVERLARVLNHTITVRSRPGKGSIFSVTLPRAEIAAVNLSGPSALNAMLRQRSLEGLIVAAIDNERHILKGMEVLLQGWDCVVETGTGLADLEATLHARSIVPDVILADFHIDETDGLGVIEALRERYGHCPAVLITADRDPAIRDRAQAADVRVLNKPLKPAALRALLSQWRLVKVAAE